MPVSEVGCKESLAFIGICLDIITLPPSAQKPGIVNSGYSVTLFSIQHLVPKLSIYAPCLNQKSQPGNKSMVAVEQFDSHQKRNCHLGIFFVFSFSLLFHPHLFFILFAN